MKKRKPKLKRIKESVAEHEYKKLMSAGDRSKFCVTPWVFVILPD